METINVTSIHVALPLVQARDVTHVCIQEHTAKMARAKAIMAVAGQQGVRMHLGPIKEGTERALGGVGIATKKGAAHCVEALKGPELEEYEAMGRVQKYWVSTNGVTALAVYCLYLWQDATNNAEARQNGNDLLQALLPMIEADQMVPTLVLGDLNAETAVYPQLSALIERAVLTDLGADPRYPDMHGVGTCLAKGATEHKRRDFILANSRARRMVKEVWIDTDGGFDVHRPVGCKLDMGAMAPPLVRMWAPKTFKEVLPKQAGTERVDRQMVEEAVSAEMDAARDDLEAALRWKDPDLAWKVWAEAAERGLAKAAGKAGEKDYRGRGQPKVRTRAACERVELTQGEARHISAPNAHIAEKLRAQRRLAELAQRTAKKALGGTQQWGPTEWKLLENIKKQTDINGMDPGLLADPQGTAGTTTRFVLALKAAAAKLAKEADLEAKEVVKARRQETKAKYTSGPNKPSKAAYRTLRPYDGGGPSLHEGGRRDNK